MFSFRQEIIFIINLYYRTLSYLDEAYMYLLERVDKAEHIKVFEKLDYQIKHFKDGFRVCKEIYRRSRIEQGKTCEVAFLECLHLYTNAAGAGLYSLSQIPPLIQELDKHVGLPYYYVEGEVFRGESMEPSKQVIHACLFLDSYVSRIQSPYYTRIADKYGIDVTFYNKSFGYKPKKK